MPTLRGLISPRPSAVALMLGRAVSTGVNWVEVDFSGANLSDAVLGKTVHDASTKWPAGFPP